MLTRLRQLVSAPVFNDSEKTRQARMLHTILVTGFGLALFTIAAAFTSGLGIITGLVSIFCVLLLYLVTTFLLLTGNLKTANVLLPTLMWIVVTASISFSGGIQGMGLGAYIIVILIARLLLGVRAGVDFTIASILASLGVLIAQILDILPASIFPDSLITSWMAQIIIFIWIAVLLHITNRNLNEAVERAHHDEHALAESNLELQNIRSTLETHMHDLERRIIQLQVASDVARDAAALGSVDDLLARSINLVRERFGFYHAGIFMLDDRGEYAILRAASGEAGQQMLDSRHKLKIGDVGMVSYAVGTGQPRIALDVGADAIYFKNPFLPETRSEMVLPLKTGNKVIGAIDVQSKEPAAFDNEDIIILQTLADQLAVAIENARLFEATRRQIEELTILHTVATAGAEATSQDALIERATQLIGETLYPDHFGVLLVDDVAGVLRFHTSYRGLSEDLRRLTVPLGRGISGRVAITGRPIRVSDVTVEREYISIKSQMRCELCVPLKIGERIIGVINAESSRRNSFTDADERLLSTFAGQLATAVEKVRLFEVERRRVMELEALRQASLHMTSNLDMKSVLEAILQHALELVAADNAVIYLYDGEKLEYGTALWPGKEIGQSLPPPRPFGLTNRVATSGKRLVVPDASNHPLYEDYPWNGAIAGLPLRRGEKVIGVMNLAFQDQPHEFDENELRVLELLADQAAVGVVNAQRYEEEQHRAEELAIALAQREELVRLKNEFIQNVSHELRTPLTIVRGYVELLEKGELGALEAEQQDAMTIIARRIHMLHRMIEDLTTILEAEARTAHHKPIELNDLIQRTVDDFQDTTRQAGLDLFLEVPPDRMRLMGDPVHLSRLLDNLIGNAIKFTPSGGSITIRLKREDGTAILEVSDTGVGIPGDKLDRVFDRFYQVDGSSTRRYGGTGLGLALVKEIAISHGGQVSVESTLGKGSIFRVNLPLNAE
jgi:signal transduction histidine kinase